MKKVIGIVIVISIIFSCFAFSVCAAGLTVVEANYPTEYTEGSYFSVRGTVTSDYTITSVTAGVYDASGNTQFEYTATPWTTSYNIANLDYYMTFSKLKAGSYVYMVKASDSQTKDAVLINRSFVVKEKIVAETGLQKVNWEVVDLSYWNEISSWDELASAVDGVILRIGYTTTVTHVINSDFMFDSFYKEAKARGLHVGCYYFSAALSEEEAVSEAEFVIKTLKDNKYQLDMPVYYDMETDAQVELSQSDCTKVARAFFDKVEENGFYAGLYCNKYFARDEVHASQLSDVTFWIAEYGTACTYEGAYGMWQYTENGTVPGIDRRVDKNYCYYDYPSHIIEKGFNGYAESEPEPTYSVKIINGIRIDNKGKLIYRVPSKLTTESFKSTYLTCSSNVDIVFDKTVDGNVATGSTFTFKHGDTVLESYMISVRGDVDCDSVINSLDALCVLENIVGKQPLSWVRAVSADCTGDDVINSNDALEILMMAIR